MYRKRIEEHRMMYGTVAILALCGVLYMFFNILDGWSKYRESTKRLEASENELAHLSGQFEELKKTRQHASSTTGMEMQVRSKFDLAKPDENIVFIIEEEEEVPLKEEKGMKKFFNSFKNIFN